jgi:hypothetical protein
MLEEGAVWRGKGTAADQTIKILRVSIDRQRITFERLSGAPDHALHKEVRAPRANIEAAFEPVPASEGG